MNRSLSFCCAAVLAGTILFSGCTESKSAATKTTSEGIDITRLGFSSGVFQTQNTWIYYYAGRDGMQGKYETKVSGKTVKGSFNSCCAMPAPEFEDVSVGQNGKRSVCKGTMEISLDKSQQNLDATWHVASGTNCADIGKTYRLKLARAKETGSIDSKILEGVNHYRVVDTDSTGLNCRKPKTLEVVKTFKFGTYLTAPSRFYDAPRSLERIYTDAKGSPWILVTTLEEAQNRTWCYVNAAWQYVRPAGPLGE